VKNSTLDPHGVLNMGKIPDFDHGFVWGCFILVSYEQG
jgi:hypothetical protein